MLTADLLRFGFSSGRVSPRYIDIAAKRYRSLASDLIDILAERRDGSHEEIDDAFGAYEGSRVQYRVQRGIVKILKDAYCDFVAYQPLSSDEVRRTVFAMAREQHPIVSPGDRSGVIRAVAAQYGTTPDEIEMLLYADLPENHRLDSFVAPSVDQLLMRYNVALAQGLLLRADNLQLLVRREEGIRFGVIFRYVKLCGLIHVIESTDKIRYRIHLDGPVQLFRHTRAYGLRMAKFLPGLLLCSGWKLQADIRLADGRRGQFELDDGCDLVSHHVDRGQFDSMVEEAFAVQFAQLRTEWSLHREADVVDLGEEVMIPDFVLRHPDGRSALLEIVGYWRPDYLRRKIERLHVAGRRDMIVAVSRHLSVAEEDLKDLGGVVWFSRRLRPREVIEAAEEVARCMS